MGALDKGRVGALDWRILLVVFLIAGIGIATIYSATKHQGDEPSLLFLKQLTWVGAGLVVFIIVSLIDYHTLARYAYPIYGVMLAFLIGVLIMGRVGMGARRWISLGIVDVQPSELAKLVLILVLAKYFSEEPVRGGLRPRDLILPLFLVLIPVGLILQQPDLGTGLTLVTIAMCLFFLAGIRYRSVAFLALLGLMVFPFFWNMFWDSLRTYQQNRLLTFVDPTSDPLGTGYHVIQSKIAVGSGGFLGKGFLGSTQSQLNFLPEGHTDFIFAVFAEEWGFLGVLVLMALYGVLIFWMIDTAYRAKDRLGVLIVVGVTGMTVFSLAVNIGMTLGIMPVVGIPLMLMSYGGTAMITIFAALGLVMSVRLRRFMLFY